MKDNNDDKKEEPVKDIENKGLFEDMVHPDKGNISEQIDQVFDFPSETVVFSQGKENKNDISAPVGGFAVPFVPNPEQEKSNYPMYNENNNKAQNNGLPAYNPNNNGDISNIYGAINNEYAKNCDDYYSAYPKNTNNNYNQYNDYNNNYGNNNYNPYPNINNNNNRNYGNNYNNNNIPKNNNINQYGGNPNNNNNNNNNSQLDRENGVLKILNSCEQKIISSITLYKARHIEDSKLTIQKVISTLDILPQTLQAKNITNPSFPQKIATLRAKAFKTFFELNLQSYIFIHTFSRYTPYNQSVQLDKYAEQYVLRKSFISFNDIFDPAAEGEKLKFKLTDIYLRAQRTGNKNLLLFGPQGSGKTLAVHALAKETDAKIVQIEGVELFQIPYFIKELARIAPNFEISKPLIFYVRNIELLFSSTTAVNGLFYLIDKFTTDSKKVLFIASSSYPTQLIPKEIIKRFCHFLNINSVDLTAKFAFFKFLVNKLGIMLQMSEQDMILFANQNLQKYSNGDIYNILKMAVDLKKQNTPGDEHPEIIDTLILNKALNIIPASLATG